MDGYPKWSPPNSASGDERARKDVGVSRCLSRVLSVPMDTKKARDLLANEKERLESLQAALIKELNSESAEEMATEKAAHDQHPAEAGTQTFERTKELAILEGIASQLIDIQHAEKKLADGTYGSCEACGEPIKQARLEALPAARLCIDDQSKAEKRP